MGYAMQVWFASSINTSLSSALHAENDTQFLNAESVSLYAVTATSAVTKINAPE